METSFSGGRSRNTRREPPTMGKQLVNFITCSCESSIPFRAPDKLCIYVFYAIKRSKNACIIRSECTHYAYILLCKQTFQIRSVLVQSCTYQYIFVFEKFPVITSLYTFRRRKRIHPRGTACLPF